MAELTAAPQAPAQIAPPAEKSAGYWRSVWRRLRRDKVAMTAGTILVLIFLMSLFATFLAPSDPYARNVANRLAGIGTPGNPLGTDDLGRDMLSRLIWGGQLSLLMGVAPVFIAFFFGSALGIIAGYAGGLTNTLIMRTVDIFYAFPSVLLAVALSGALGAGLFNAMFSLTVVFIPPIARVSESVTTQLKSSDFIEAAKASGASALTILRVHVLGNVLGPIFVYSTSLIAVSMILAAGLSFLGLGVQPPFPEWGQMLNALRNAMYVQPLVTALPGVMIFLVSISFNLLSDGLRSAMEVRT